MRLDRDAYCAFLAAHPRRRFFVDDTCKCPLACYLRSCGQKEVAVIHKAWVSRTYWRRNPPWAARHVAAVDFWPHATITGAQTLKLLERKT